MNFLSVCSGIEAASVAWGPLSMKAVAFSEIEPFPSAVLAHHYPDVPNWGDMTKYQEWPDAAIDLLVGGTPCQSFSVAGLRKGLADPRGNLMLTYGAIAAKYRPTWLVWENVPGVLSSNGGKDFGAFLGMLAELGYGFAYRVLDAQYFGVAQRRRRVFVVGYLGDWRRAAAVLFERQSLSGHPAPSREAGKNIAGTISSRSTAGGGLGADFDLAGGLQVAGAITAHAFTGGAGGRPEGASANHFVTHVGVAGTLDASYARLQGCSGQDANHGHSHLVAHTLLGKSHSSHAADQDTYVPVAIPINDMATRHAGTDGSGHHSGKGHGLGVGHNTDPMFTLTKGDKHAVAYRTAGDGAVYEEGDATAPLTTGTDKSANIISQPVNIYGGNKRKDRPDGGFYVRMDEDTSKTLDSSGGLNPACSQGGTAVINSMKVRRLIPRECERLQGFPDDYTLIPVRNKPAADGPRYKALGNSMAVPVMAWIGGRIDQVNQLISQQEAA